MTGFQIPLIGAALQYAQTILGGPLTEAETNPTIGTAVADVIIGNGDRVGLVVINLGTQDLYIGLNSGISSTNGIKLAASGGNIAMDVVHDYTLVTRNWKGIAPGGNTNVYVLEIFRVSAAPGGYK